MSSKHAGNDEKLRVERLYKVFGDDPDDTIRRVEAGHSKKQIYADTGSVAAVADVSFGVQEGEIFVVMGLSGSGKSTLIRCLNRLIEPTRGSIRIDGEEIVGLDAEALRRLRREKLSMVFQHFALFPHKTVGENVEYGLKIRGLPAQERRDKALRSLEQVGLEAYADVPPDNLSGGMQQRVGLARGLAVDPDLMLMDEPFSALDPLIRRDMQDELLELQQELRMTIVFITHDLHEALRLGDRIAIMKDGRFVQLGSPQEIVAQPADDYVAAFTRDVDRARVFRARTLRRDAEALSADASVAAARVQLTRLERSALYVVDDYDRPQGVVRREALEANGLSSLDEALVREFPTADAEQELVELYSACAAGLPVALLDDEGRLTGIVEPLEVFQLLGGNGGGDDADGASSAGNTAGRPGVTAGSLEMRRPDHG
ncbi:glycine betaine/L-proline ABC transporter ATP-binding protein [Halomonas sp. NO4]|uniref:quaternary amine ABC transporter ATP-binding protein n=1 Tax=Halomonas sp. NO4 TaxID=2484813 RepID=UPI0013D4EC58|nr:glycine betaine/L-proline ABC transporter ATP-binding protein [Halomonas sp. NO4]